MADKTAKQEQNVPGKYYVDDQCIACDVCCLEAPKSFLMNDEEGHAYVNKQPENEEEKQECESALEQCPVGAIGNDGES